MSKPNPYRSPTFVRIKEKYQALKQPHEQALNELEQAQESIWRNSIEYKLLSKLSNLPRIPGFLAFYGGMFLFTISFSLAKDNNHGGFLIFLGFLAYVLIPKIVDLIGGSVRTNVIQCNQQQLRSYEHRADAARSILSNVNKAYSTEWESACETYSSYPPDWQNRCEKVKARDGYKCTACGYPEGFRRRSRELHVHHSIALSDGGTNDLNNLVTLCHICHRKVDKKHAGVRKMRLGRST